MNAVAYSPTWPKYGHSPWNARPTLKLGISWVCPAYVLLLAILASRLVLTGMVARWSFLSSLTSWIESNLPLNGSNFQSNTPLQPSI